MTTREHSGAKARIGVDADGDLKRLVRMIARQAAQEAFLQFKADLEAIAAKANPPSEPERRTDGAAHEPAIEPITSPDPEDRFLSIAEVAKRFGVSEKTVRRKIATGDLPAHRVGRLIRIGERGLLARLATGRLSQSDRK